jgi:hypothetical protein
LSQDEQSCLGLSSLCAATVKARQASVRLGIREAKFYRLASCTVAVLNLGLCHFLSLSID